MSDSQTRLINKTIGLLYSMIDSGEQHSSTSEKMVDLSYQAIDDIEQRLASGQVDEEIPSDEKVLIKGDGYVITDKRWYFNSVTFAKHPHKNTKEEKLNVDGTVTFEGPYINMNLYKVEVHGLFDSTWIYVIAPTPNDAQDKALDKMRALEWKYTHYAGSVELVACEKHQKGADLVVV